MIKLKNLGYGSKNHVSELIMAGSSVDDIFVIVLFYSFKNLVSSNTFNYLTLIQIPTSIILGILLGIIIGILLSLLFKKINFNNISKIIILLSISFLLIYLENYLKKYISISSLLSIIVIAIIINKKSSIEAKKIQDGYNSMWQVFEILLFTFVGCITNIKLAFSTNGLLILLLILIGLLFRSIGVLLCIIKTKYAIKEKLFIIISNLPKATVQASIGGIALSEGLSCGSIVLTSAVVAILFTKTLGAILMDSLYDKLLIKDNDLSFINLK